MYESCLSPHCGLFFLLASELANSDTLGDDNT